MTFVTDITKEDLLAMIDERLKMPAPPAQQAVYRRLAERIRNEFDASEPLLLSFDGKGMAVRRLLIGVALQALYCKDPLPNLPSVEVKSEK